jgi:outer membrane lipoprotein-sorting protein
MKGPSRKGMLILILWAFGMTMTLGPVRSDETGSDRSLMLARVITKIQEREASLMTFTASFEQVKRTHLLKEPLRSKGDAFFDRRGKMLIRVKEPFPFLLLLTKNRLITYAPDEGEMEERYLGPATDVFKTIFGMGASNETFRKEYDIDLVSGSETGGYRLRLIPKPKSLARRIKRIEALVRSDTWLPAEIFLEEDQGDCTSVSVQFISINKPLPEGIFDIKVPEERRHAF